jgi:hypothetical protein
VLGGCLLLLQLSTPLFLAHVDSLSLSHSHSLSLSLIRVGSQKYTRCAGRCWRMGGGERKGAFCN